MKLIRTYCANWLLKKNQIEVVLNSVFFQNFRLEIKLVIFVIVIEEVINIVDQLFYCKLR